jgi:hypothetical protein
MVVVKVYGVSPNLYRVDSELSQFGRQTIPDILDKWGIAKREEVQVFFPLDVLSQVSPEQYHIEVSLLRGVFQSITFDIDQLIEAEQQLLEAMKELIAPKDDPNANQDFQITLEFFTSSCSVVMQSRTGN